MPLSIDKANLATDRGFEYHGLRRTEPATRWIQLEISTRHIPRYHEQKGQSGLRKINRLAPEFESLPLRHRPFHHGPPKIIGIDFFLLTTDA